MDAGRVRGVAADGMTGFLGCSKSIIKLDISDLSGLFVVSFVFAVFGDRGVKIELVVLGVVFDDNWAGKISGNQKCKPVLKAGVY